jgi:protein phosphatase
MPLCPACGSDNRASARYCWSCAAPLAPAVAPPVEPRPTPDDARWLETALASQQGAPPAPRPLNDPAAPPAPSAEEPAMEPVPAVPALFAGRYELAPADAATAPLPAPVAVEALDHTPWARCWACGYTENEAGERFCTNCGADLNARRYRGQLAPADVPAGVALIASVEDDAARAVLPAIWDQASENGRTLTLLNDTGRTPLSPPLDELAALQVGIGLARLLETLHASGLALGDLAPGDLALSATGAPQLLNVPGLRCLPEDADGRAGAASSDLRALGVLLESLTATPRTTRRLEEDDTLDLVEAQEGDASLGAVLRDLRTGAFASGAALAESLQGRYEERTRPMPLRARIGAATHTGVVRQHNEDSMFTLDMGLNNTSLPHSWGLYIVADGMGGHAAGEVASGLAIRGAAEVVLAEYLANAIDVNSPYDEARSKEIVRSAVLQANKYVLGEAKARGNDMGTTITMALVVDDRAIIGNVGDSRTYLFRDGELQRISKDHSLVMRLVELGQITEDDIYTHPQRNAVLRSLGDKAEIEVDIFSQRLRPGDALFLCSDGQWEMTHNPEMTKLIASHEDPQQACDTLVAAANEAGGEDNITAVLVKLEALQ